MERKVMVVYLEDEYTKHHQVVADKDDLDILKLVLDRIYDRAEKRVALEEKE